MLEKLCRFAGALTVRNELSHLSRATAVGAVREEEGGEVEETGTRGVRLCGPHSLDFIQVQYTGTGAF